MEASIFIQAVYKITGIGSVPVGNVTKGILKIGMKANIGGKVMTIKTIEQHHEQISEAPAGQNVGFSFDNGDYEILKACSRQEIRFSDESIPVTSVQIRPEPTRPKGLMDSIKNLFHKK